MPQWLVYALLSAASAAFVGIFGKIGMKGIDSSLATAVRSVVMAVFLLAACTVMGLLNKIPSLHSKALGAIVLSGVAGAVSWLFYFRAIQVGTVSQVAPIDKLSVALAVVMAFTFLGEKPTTGNVLAAILVTAGVLVAVFVR